MHGKGVTHPEEVTRTLIREWGASLYDRWQPATVKQAISAAKGYAKWCHEEKHTPTNVGKALITPKVKHRIQRTLTGSEITAMLNACDTSPTGVRNTALILLLLDSGLRSNELCQLQTSALDLETGTLIVVGKGGGEQHAYYGEETSKRLEAWLSIRQSQPGSTVFISIGGIQPGQPLTPSGLRRILRNIGDRAGIKNVSTHAFRRAFACIATEAGAPTRDVQIWGRWSDIRQVETYTAALQAAKLYQKFSPSGFIGR